jgi:TRAP-type uncharacterized transport system fused permease subunit
LGVYLHSSAVQGWFFGHLSMPLRALLMLAAFGMIDSGFATDAFGLVAALLVWAIQKRLIKTSSIARGLD